jgi:hypothetical protein
MRDPDIAGRRIIGENADEIDQLALGTAADHLIVVKRADPGAVIAAIFHPLEAIDQTVCYAVRAYNADNAAHFS